MYREKQEENRSISVRVILPVVEKDLHKYWGEKERILRELVRKEWEIPFSKRSYISKATILNGMKRDPSVPSHPLVIGGKLFERASGES